MDDQANDAIETVRTIFISDQHLGFRFSRAEACLNFLRSYRSERLYLVGDFLDGWRLKNHWHWPPVYNELVDHILGMIGSGTQVFYTPGNHDDFLRRPHPAVNGVEVADEFIHELLDGSRLLITHGDLFDSVEKKHHRLSRFGSTVYDGVTRVNFFTNKMMTTVGLREFNYCFAAKRLSKRIVGAVGGFESTLTQHARHRQCRGVVCGHIHRPTLKQSKKDSFIYCNTGDWVENRSAVIETLTGDLVLKNHGQDMASITINGKADADAIASASAVKEPAAV